MLKRCLNAEATRNDVVRPFVGQKSKKLQVLLICAVLILSTVAAYWQVHKYQFVSLDDFKYVVENNHVINGFSRSGLVWAFTTNTMGNWHPLTWLSFMLDCQLPGPKARTCHTVNLLFHIANTLLLFYLLKRMTNQPWRSAFVAALFALHPLHVESVAWVSERKDVLSTFFWLLTMCAYVRYAMKPNFVRYTLTLLFFCLGLMAKPMLVTLPFVLLLMDYWPLRRWPLATPNSSTPTAIDIPTGNHIKLLIRLIAEKLPLFTLAAISCVVAYLVQQSMGSIHPYALLVRIANAALAYTKYIWLMFWPTQLAPIYPYPQGIPIAIRIIAALFLLGISTLVILLRRPYLIVGYLWYLGTLVPVIGVVQIGSQAMADRYTYVPLIGLFIAVTWAAADLSKTIPFRKIILSTVAAAILIAAGICTHFQVRHWRNSICLYEHTLAVTRNNWMAHNGMGAALYNQGKIDIEQGKIDKAQRKIDKAIEHFRETLRIFPRFNVAMANLVITLNANGQFDQAISNGRQFSLLAPTDYRIHKALADALVRRTKKHTRYSFNATLTVQDMRDLDEAVEHYKQVLQLTRGYFQIHYLLAEVLARQGKLDDAIVHYRQTLQINPDYSNARYALQETLAKRNKLRKKTMPNKKP